MEFIVILILHMIIFSTNCIFIIAVLGDFVSHNYQWQNDYDAISITHFIYMTTIANNDWKETILYARQHDKSFIYIITFNLHNNPIK